MASEFTRQRNDREADCAVGAGGRPCRPAPELTGLPRRSVIDPKVLADKSVIRGTRLAVEFISELLAAGQSESESPRQ